MKTHKRKFDEGEIKFFIGNKYYFVDVNQNIRLYKHLFGPKLTNIEKVFGRYLKEKNTVHTYKDEDYNGTSIEVDGELYWKGKIDITIEGLLSTAYQISGITKYKSLFHLIDEIFRQAEPNTSNYWAGDKELFMIKKLGYNLNIVLDFNYIYNDTLTIKIDVDWFREMKRYKPFFEFNQSDYLKWKKKNVTYRGMKKLGTDNEVYGSFGKGLYTAPLSNKAMAKTYGDLYFVVNAIPKKPKIVNSLNDAEIVRQGLVANFCKKKNVDYNPSFF